jgi:hypothetical protein
MPEDKVEGPESGNDGEILAGKHIHTPGQVAARVLDLHFLADITAGAAAFHRVEDVPGLVILEEIDQKKPAAVAPISGISIGASFRVRNNRLQD